MRHLLPLGTSRSSLLAQEGPGAQAAHRAVPECSAPASDVLGVKLPFGVARVPGNRLSGRWLSSEGSGGVCQIPRGPPGERPGSPAALFLTLRLWRLRPFCSPSVRGGGL